MQWGQGSPVRRAQIAAIALHAGEWSIRRLPSLFGIPEPERKDTGWDCFGYVVGDGLRWRIALHERIAGTLENTTLAHEVGHTFQTHWQKACCSPSTVMQPLEQEAHILASIFCVPFAAIERLDWRNHDEVRAIARDLEVTPSYVYMRDAAAIFLGEKAGTERSASWRLNEALQAHQRWMMQNAPLLRETDI